MKRSILRKKPAQAALALALAAGIVLTGSVAWYSFQQSKVNMFRTAMAPDVNLHDDFAGGPNKDIYVENSGPQDIFVRVRLTEFLQTEDRGALVEGQLRDDDKANWWAPHNGAAAEGGPAAPNLCALTGADHTAPAWTGENFHDYYIWTMGGAEGGATEGQIYFKPASEDQKSIFDESGTLIQEPQVVSDPLTETAGDAHLAYAEQVKALTDQGKTENEALVELGLKKTLAAQVVPMSDWTAGTGGVGKYELGSFWVMDEADGWCYWAGPLEAQTATGLLLDRVDRTNKPFDSNAEYRINAWLQAVDKNDLGRFEMEGNGGISENGKTLILLAAGQLDIAEDGSTYYINDDGTYTQFTDATGAETAEARAFLPLAVDEATGESLGVNTPAESRIYVGDRVDLTELAWNGENYDNYDALSAAANNGWYNLTKGEAGAYEFAGTEVREDGGIYLRLNAAASGGLLALVQPSDTVYLASVVQETPAATAQAEPAVMALAVEPETATTSYTVPAYRTAMPGTGPYGMVYPGADGTIGTGDDALYPEGDMTEPFLLGKTSADLEPGGTFTADGQQWIVLHVDEHGNRLITAKDWVLPTPITYIDTGAGSLVPPKGTFQYSYPRAVLQDYYASELSALKPFIRKAEVRTEQTDNSPYDATLNDPAGLSVCLNAPAEADKDGSPVFILSQAEVLTYMTEANGLDQYRKVATATGGNGGWWTRSPANVSKIAYVGNDNNLYATTWTTSDTRYVRPAMWVRFSDGDAAALTHGGTAEDLAAWKGTSFAESFLAGKSSEDLKVGGSFTADGVEWFVLDVDEYGNRLISTEATICNATAADQYADSDIADRFQKYAQGEYEIGNGAKLVNLKPYVLDAYTPVEAGAFSPTRNEPGALSIPVATKNNPAVFALSQSEWLTYDPAQYFKHNASNTALWTRSPAGTGNSVYMTAPPDEASTPVSTYNAHPICVNPSMWVRFSDADAIATAPAEDLAAWKWTTFAEPFLLGKQKLTRGDSFTADGTTWYVLAVDEYGNRLLSTTDYVSGAVALAGHESYYATKLKDFYDGKEPFYHDNLKDRWMPSVLKPYVLDAATPVETVAFAVDRNEAGALSYALPTKSNPTAFALSQSDWLTYKPNDVLQMSSTGRLTRTPADESNSAFTGVRVLIDAEKNVTFEQMNSFAAVNPCLWVRFSDADRIATATAEEMAEWKSGYLPSGANGSKVIVDGTAFRVVASDGDKVLLTTWNTVGESAYRATGGQYYPGSTAQEAVTAWYTGLPEDGKIRTNALKPTTFPDNTGYTDIPTALAGAETVDVAFLPSWGDWSKYMPKAADRIPGDGKSWWYRSSLQSGINFYIKTNGEFANQAVTETCGIRPFVWVNYKALQ